MGQWENHIRILTIGISLMVVLASALLIFSVMTVDDQQERETIRGIDSSRTSIFGPREQIENFGVDEENGRVVLFLTTTKDVGLFVSDDESQTESFDLKAEFFPTYGEPLSLNGNFVTWRTEYRYQGDRVPFVVLLNLSEPKSPVYRTIPAPNLQGPPVIWEEYLFWSNGTDSIMVHDINANETSQCKTNTIVGFIRVNDGIMMWSGTEEDIGNIYWRPVVEVIGFNSTIGARLLRSELDQDSPARSGDNYIFIQREDGPEDDGQLEHRPSAQVVLYDNISSDGVVISRDPLSPENPTISGNLTAWEELNPDTLYEHHIMVYNISSKELIRLSSETRDRRHPLFFGSHLLWLQERNGRTRLYSLDVDELRPRIKVVPGFDIALALSSSLFLTLLTMTTRRRRRVCPPAETPHFMVCTRHAPAADPAGGCFVRYRGCPKRHSRPR